MKPVSADTGLRPLTLSVAYSCSFAEQLSSYCLTSGVQSIGISVGISVTVTELCIVTELWSYVSGARRI